MFINHFEDVFSYLARDFVTYIFDRMKAADTFNKTIAYLHSIFADKFLLHEAQSVLIIKSFLSSISLFAYLFIINMWIFEKTQFRIR
ncbi:MAG: hypothetical protein FWC34_09430 [Bacteroidetes bacterium]|nr:hypothetical protein [Bacteroidota bacterium]MCL2303508.1 hypothetical protein [Lentimicrobiaceae bacterium]